MSVHPYLQSLLQITGNGEIEVPEWLATSMTNILPKNADSHLAKNYRPIACQNITSKLYTGYHSLYDHCSTNNTITVEQAGGKKGVWGCTDQLLINKMILDEVRFNRQNLFMMWFDYKKAFDSIPHQWLLEALKLAKIPDASKCYLQTYRKVGDQSISPHKRHRINYRYNSLFNRCTPRRLFVTTIIYFMCQSIITPPR